MGTSMKVLYLVNIPSPYRVSFFNELGKLCELTVLFERRSSTDREVTWHDYNTNNFRAKFLNGIKYKANTALCFEVIKFLSDNKFDVIVIGGYSTPTGVLAINYLRLKRIPFILNIDGGLINQQESRGKYLIKKYFISSASSWLSTGIAASSYLEYYGAKADSIYIYPFTTLSEADILKNVIDDVIKKQLKHKLNIREKKAILTVGQFICRKGFDVLLNACAELHSDCGVYFIGGEPTKEYLKLKKDLNLRNIHFIGYMSKENLAEYYKASDLFVLPTREDIWGLVINEAMAYGLPVITTEKCVAGLELVKNYENGFIIPADNVEMLAKKINELIDNNALTNKMAERSLKKISNYTIENMANETKLIFTDILKKKLNSI